MKLNYYPETDSLYIDLIDRTSVESREVSAGVVLDYDTEGRVVGIDHASSSARNSVSTRCTSANRGSRSPVRSFIYRSRRTSIITDCTRWSRP